MKLEILVEIKQSINFIIFLSQFTFHLKRQICEAPAKKFIERFLSNNQFKKRRKIL